MSRRYTGCRPVDAERLGRQIDRHRAGERVGDDERRRREVVGAHLLLDAAFEVAVAAQHRRDDEVAFASTSADTSSGSGPLLPMQVVQP